MDESDRYVIGSHEVTILIAARNILDTTAQRLLIETPHQAYYAGRTQARCTDAGQAIWAALSDLSNTKLAPVSWNEKGQPQVTPARLVATRLRDDSSEDRS